MSSDANREQSLKKCWGVVLSDPLLSLNSRLVNFGFSFRIGRPESAGSQNKVDPLAVVNLPRQMCCIDFIENSAI